MENQQKLKTILGLMYPRTRKRGKYRCSSNGMINTLYPECMYTVPNTTCQGFLSNNKWTFIAPREVKIQKRRTKKPKLTGRQRRRWLLAQKKSN